MNKKVNITINVMGVVFIFVLFILLLADILFGIRFFSIPLTIVGMILTIVAIILANYIALTQKKSIYKLECIGRQTQEIIEDLKTKSEINKIVRNFFIFDKEKGRKTRYKCFFPVENGPKPLPFINQGDFYAIHVLSTRLGEDNLDLIRITQKKNFI